MIRVPLIPVGSGQRRVMLPDDLQFTPIQEEGVRSPCPPREGKSLGSLAPSASRQILGGAGAFLANKSRLVQSCDCEKTGLFSRPPTKYPQARRSKRRCCGQKTGKCCGLRDEPTFPAPHARFAMISPWGMAPPKAPAQRSRPRRPPTGNLMVVIIN